VTKSTADRMEEQLTELAHDMGEAKIALEILREKQGSQIKRHDSIKESFHQHRESMKDCFNKIEKRLHALEDFMLASTQRLSMLKGLVFKGIPILVAVLLAVCALCFSLGIFVEDTEKTVDKVKHTIERKA
jgi:hypothetical protein